MWLYDIDWLFLLPWLNVFSPGLTIIKTFRSNPQNAILLYHIFRLFSYFLIHVSL